jgi:hypothetical protein
MSEYNTNEIQATAIYNYKREALAFIGSKFEEGISTIFLQNSLLIYMFYIFKK